VRLSISPIPSWRSSPRIVFSSATSCDCKVARAVSSRPCRCASGDLTQLSRTRHGVHCKAHLTNSRAVEKVAASNYYSVSASTNHQVSECQCKIQMSVLLQFRTVSGTLFCFGRAAGGRGAPGVAQRPTGARCTALETAPVV
jgi:hypothetical protein